MNLFTAKSIGLRKRFEGEHFKLSEKWLQEKRTEILLEWGWPCWSGTGTRCACSVGRSSSSRS